MDRVLHAERLAGKTKRMHRRAIDTLPDGAMIARAGEAFAVRGRDLLRWTPAGYAQAVPRPHAVPVDVLTPPGILAVLVARICSALACQRCGRLVLMMRRARYAVG